MKKLNYLNVGCGHKYNKSWINVDMTAHSPDVISANLINGIPFPDNHFEVVYHSQVLEHFPKEKASGFITECFRVLKPGGILRVVVPDLENIVDEYKKHLTQNLTNPTPISEANYDWLMLEMYDQTVRNHSGGLMAEYFRKPEMVNEKYVFDRIGFVGRSIREEYLKSIHKNDTKTTVNTPSFKTILRRLKSKIRSIYKPVPIINEATQIGNFRLGGEVHMWMYDRYSLSRLLIENGFKETYIMTPFESKISDWNSFELDVKGDIIYDPTSLFMEARK